VVEVLTVINLMIVLALAAMALSAANSFVPPSASAVL